MSEKGRVHTFSIVELDKEKEMFVDLRMAKVEPEYRRQKLSRSYPKVSRVAEHNETERGDKTQWSARFARLLALSR